MADKETTEDQGIEPKAAGAAENVTLPGTSDDNTEIADEPGLVERIVEGSVKPQPESVTPVIKPPPPRRGAGGLILGGIIAALIGAGAMYVAQLQGWVTFTDNSALVARLETLEAEVGAREAAIADVATQRDALVAVTTRLTDLGAQSAARGEALSGLTGDVTDLAARMSVTDARLAEVETQPIPKADLPDEIVKAFEERLATMMTEARSEQDTRVAEIETRLNSQLTALATAQADAEASEEEAKRAAATAAARAALSRLRVALDTGAPYATDLDALRAASSLEIPAELAASSAEGAPTLSALQAAFPDLARSALTETSRVAAAEGEMDPLIAFIRVQLGARSLEPKEGNDPDAVLSRAEAAVNAGDLDAALAEISALPDVGQDIFAAWRARAETRHKALTAAAVLNDSLNGN